MSRCASADVVPDIALGRRRSLASRRLSNLMDSGVVMHYIVAQALRSAGRAGAEAVGHPYLATSKPHPLAVRQRECRAAVLVRPRPGHVVGPAVAEHDRLAVADRNGVRRPDAQFPEDGGSDPRVLDDYRRAA